MLNYEFMHSVNIFSLFAGVFIIISQHYPMLEKPKHLRLIQKICEGAFLIFISFSLSFPILYAAMILRMDLLTPDLTLLLSVFRAFPSILSALFIAIVLNISAKKHYRLSLKALYPFASISLIMPFITLAITLLIDILCAVAIWQNGWLLQAIRHIGGGPLQLYTTKSINVIAFIILIALHIRYCVRTQKGSLLSQEI